ncbi:hypothetical protein O9993_02320 [Vibrio lentus]|nr:hypothetical protein [Vibrio lentus]
MWFQQRLREAVGRYSAATTGSKVVHTVLKTILQIILEYRERIGRVMIFVSANYLNQLKMSRLSVLQFTVIELKCFNDLVAEPAPPGDKSAGESS